MIATGAPESLRHRALFLEQPVQSATFKSLTRRRVPTQILDQPLSVGGQRPEILYANREVARGPGVFEANDPNSHRSLAPPRRRFRQDGETDSALDHPRNRVEAVEPDA